jgi:predicted glycogen debranching enzyme
MALQRKISLANANAEESHDLLRREWLVTNGLGGYASGTIAGCVTRRYHGLLVAAHPAPLGRLMMFNHLAERVRLADGRVIQIGGGADPDKNAITEFRLDFQVPTWRYEVAGIVIEKRLLILHRQNTVHLTYTLLSDHEMVALELQPSVQFRGHDQSVSTEMRQDYGVYISTRCYEIQADGWPSLRLAVSDADAEFLHRAHIETDVNYKIEADRGYDSVGHLWSPGYFLVNLHKGQSATLLASTEPWNIIGTLDPDFAFRADEGRRRRLIEQAHPAARQGPAAELVLAADQFIISPAGRVEDSARAHAAGDEIRTVIAGYHWFTDWGRDTMISLEGLTLTTGRKDEARWILRTFAHYIKDGLIPNMFPEGQNDGLYHTADATLWFFHALQRYLRATDDRATLKLVLPKLMEVVNCHLKGTRFGIGVDPVDGLLRQGEKGYQLTWMDAKVEGWVVTPRRGKAVEINALWYNALRLLESWLEEEERCEEAEEIRRRADQVYHSFNVRFWNGQNDQLFDVVDGEDGDDPACRPNQILAISLDHAVLDPARWAAVVRAVEEKLFTPVGLRSLEKSHPDYKARYDGDLRSRDAAYHQGTVWGWLIGPFMDAWMKVHPGRGREARKLLDGLLEHLDDAGVGSLSEVFDAEPPYRARGCIAQAWSVAEALRCWVATSDPSPNE